ncbi:hypothetical protein SVIOM342S_06892 [Streptomyces violaceorubidus]
MFSVRCRIPNVPSKGDWCRKAPVSSRSHSPPATPSTRRGPELRTRPSPARGVPSGATSREPTMANRSTSAGRTTSARYASTFSANSTYVTTGVVDIRPPAMVRARRAGRAPSFAHSGHWWPTGAARMQSGQMKRSQRVQRTWHSTAGWR